MSTLKDILDIGLKYGPEASNYFTGQRRLKEQIKNQREEMFPEFQRKNLSASQQDLSNMANRDNSAFARGEEARGLADALDVSGSTKGGQRQLAKLLGASSTNQQKLSEAEARNRASLLQQAGANEASVMDYNRNLSDSEEMFDLQKERQLDYLGDQEKRLKGKGAGSFFDMANDISSLFPKNKITEDDVKNKITEEGGDVNDLLGMLNAAEGPEAERGSSWDDILQSQNEFPIMSDPKYDRRPDNALFGGGRSRGTLSQLMSENEQNKMGAYTTAAGNVPFVELEDGGAVVTPDGYDHDGVDILMTDRSNGQPLGTVESAEMIVNASDAKKGIALAKKNPKSPTSKWFLQLAKRFEKEAKNRK
jgi:hypothetical protein